MFCCNDELFSCSEAKCCCWGRLNILQGGDKPDPLLDRKLLLRKQFGQRADVRNQFGQSADIRQGKIGRRQGIDGRRSVEAKGEYRPRQDRFPGGSRGCCFGFSFGLFGSALRFRCLGHVHRPQIVDNSEPSLDRPHNGSLTRHPPKNSLDYGQVTLIPRYRLWPKAERMQNQAAGGELSGAGRFLKRSRVRCIRSAPVTSAAINAEAITTPMAAGRTSENEERVNLAVAWTGSRTSRSGSAQARRGRGTSSDRSPCPLMDRADTTTKPANSGMPQLATQAANILSVDASGM